MFDYSLQRHHRIAQFAFYLKLMHHRSHVEGHGSCFLLFHEPRGSTPPADQVEKACGGTLQRIPTTFAAAVRWDATQEPRGATLPCDGWRPDPCAKRYMQFSFERNWLCLDLPRRILSLDEASQILRLRSGFFYLKDRPEYMLYDEQLFEYDPLRKVYQYGEELAAAEDAVYVLLDVWGYPFDFPLHVTASTFGEGPSFELDVPLE